MKIFVSCLVLSFVLGVFAEPPRPKIAEVFEANALLLVKSPHGDDSGEGFIVVDQPKGKAREFYEFQGGYRYDVLQRFDMGKVFEVDAQKEECIIKHVNGSMPLFWGWVEEAVYDGFREYYGHTCDVWLRKFPRFVLGICTEKNVPLVFVEERSQKEYVRYDILQWMEHEPHERAFEVPHFCE